MNFSVVEWFVLVFSIVAIAKIIIVIANPKLLLGFAKSLYKAPAVVIIVELVLAGLLMNYLLREITIVQIVAGIILGALLTGMTLASYSKETIGLASKILDGKDTMKKILLPAVVWLVLMIWALVSLF